MTTERRPAVILAVDDQRESRERLQAELVGRYGRDYRVAIESSPVTALAALRAMQAGNEPVAVVMARLWMTEMNGRDMLSAVREIHPRAKRAVLIPFGGWGDAATAEAIRGGVASGSIDYYLLQPWKAPDEVFHRTLGEFLYEWARSHESVPKEVVVLAERGSPRGHELRNLLTRNGIPNLYVPSACPDGESRLAALGLAGRQEPIVSVIGGTVLVDPSNREVAASCGFATLLVGSPEVDVAIIGAGPAGLAAAVYGSSEGLDTIVIEREAIGGQAGSSSMIRNYLGFARGISGSDLAQRAYQQAWVFGTRFLTMQEICGLECGRKFHTLTTSEGGRLRARAVVLAMGVTYVRLELPAVEELLGRGVYYGASPAEAKQVEGVRVFVVGAGNSAGQAALHLAKWASDVTLVVRGDSLARSMSAYLVREIAAARNISVRLRTRIVDGGGARALENLTLQDDAAGRTEVVKADALFVLIGARPRTAWLPREIKVDSHGFVVAGTDLSHEKLLADWPLVRTPQHFEASVPGIFAVGDVRSRSLKRVASSVGEGAGAIKEIHHHFETWEKFEKTRRPVQPDNGGKG
jgi:thioredoxin reductase (NADPH)